MKKFLPKLIFIICLVGVIIGGKKYIEYKTENYTEVVSKGISKYFVTGDTKELKPIIKLLEKYEKDEVIRKDIQEYSLDIVGSLYLYLDNKYFCDKNNLNSCMAQLDEFKILNQKLFNLYETKCDDGFTIIIPSSYTNLKNQGASKVASLEKVIGLASATSPQDSEEIRKTKCATATDCSNCRDNLCTCSYVDEDKNKESITCYVLSK